MISSLLAWLSDPTHWSGPDGIPTRIVEHLAYTALTVLLAALVAIPLGLWIGHTGRGSVVAVSAAGAWRSISTRPPCRRVRTMPATMSIVSSEPWRSRKPLYPPKPISDSGMGRTG